MTEPTAIVPDKGIRAALASGADIATRLFVKAVAGSKDEMELAGDGERVHGVTMETIPDGSRGDVQTEGRAIVLSGAAVAQGANVASDAAGKAVLAASGEIVAGVAMTAAAGADEPIEVELAGVGGGHVVP